MFNCEVGAGFGSRGRAGLLAGCLIIMGFAPGARVLGGDVTWAPEVEERLNALREGSWAEMDSAVLELAQMAELAIPALASCLEDPEIQSACADILARMPAELAVRPLQDAIDRAPVTSTRERTWKAMLVAALGRLRSSDSVSYLEALYGLESDKYDRVATSVAWALKNITGWEYGPAQNPWDGCAGYVGSEEAQLVGSSP